MFFLNSALFRLLWKIVLIELRFCWAMVALIVAFTASLTGHKRVAQRWMRSLNWRRVL